MKKLLFLLSVILFTLDISKSRAQLIKSIGVRAGIASTFPAVDEAQNSLPVKNNIYNRNMIYPELQTELFPNNHFSLLANAAYISKGLNYLNYTGSGFGFFGGGNPTITHANADYFTITVAPKLIWQPKKISLYGFTGTYLGLLATYNDYYNHKIYLPNGEFTSVFILKPKTWGGTIGGGIEFKRKSKIFHYSVQAQYMQDFTKAADFKYHMTDHYGTNYDYRFKANFQTFLLSLGIHYAFKKSVTPGS